MENLEEENNTAQNNNENSTIVREEKLSRAGLLWFLGMQFLVLVFVFIFLLETGNYGWALFCAIPFSLGLTIGVYTKTYRTGKLMRGFLLVLVAIAVLSLMLIPLGFEGAICILMAEVLLAVPALLGMFFGYLIRDAHTIHILAILLIFNSSAYVYDRNDDSKIVSLTEDSVHINAPAEKVWQALTAPVKFSPHKNLLFQAGITHPQSMQLQKDGSQCFLYCGLNYTAVKLPVIQTDTFKRLRFSIPQDIMPMQELTIYDSVDAPHLKGYFLADYGEFEIQKTENNTCKLIARTSYSYKITPVFYWQWWSDYLVKTMHGKVLQDIKFIAEGK